MSWVQRRVGEDGAVRYTATYRDPAGRGRSAGTFTSRREAERAGRRAVKKSASSAAHSGARIPRVTATSLLNATPAGENVTFTGVSTDTRTMEPGDLFVALRGDRFDGHAFIDQARAAARACSATTSAA